MKNLIFLFLMVTGISLAQVPTITSFTPTSGPVGTLITITGTNIGNPVGFNIGAATAIVISKTATQVVGMVMPGAVTGVVNIITTAGIVNSVSNFTVTPTPFPGIQQGSKLVGTLNTGAAYQGYSVSLSADGNTAIMGGPNDNSNQGAAWVYTRSGSTWSQQGNKLVGTGNNGAAQQGWSVALSADGNTAIVGGIGDNSGQGAAWVYTRSGSTWSQQGAKLVGTGNTGAARQGWSVTISANGNTAIVGGNLDNSSQGAAWVYTRSGINWSQQGAKLVGSGNTGAAEQGYSVALSANGNTALVGGWTDNNNQGAAWVYIRSGITWSQQGAKLVGTSNSGARQGQSVALSANGNTAIVGGYLDNSGQGAAWVYTRSGINWSQQGSKLVGTDNTGAANQGASVALSADGNTAIVGGWTDNSNQGATWVYTRSGNTWSQKGAKLVGTGNTNGALQGRSVALSANGNTAIVGGYFDNSNQGAAWVFTVAPAPVISSFTTTSGPVGTLVTINGSNLNNPTAFTIGGTAALLVSNTGTTLVGLVMPGAATGAVSVTTSGGTATGGSNFTVTPTPYPSAQQGNKLVGSGNDGAASQGYSVSISAHGNTAIVGGPLDNSNQGAAWIYTRSGSVWTQQGGKLVGTGSVGPLVYQGTSVALSADGNTAIVGGSGDNSNQGAAWVYTRSGSSWTQQGDKLVGIGGFGVSIQGNSVALSADGNTAIVGGVGDSFGQGAAWVYTRTGSSWTQQGSKLFGTGSSGYANQGCSVALSSDGNTAIVGGLEDNFSKGAAWVYTRSGGIWTQQGTKLVGNDFGGYPNQGKSVALSADGNTALVGGMGDNGFQGAAWVFTRSGINWSQQGGKLVGTGNIGAARQGNSVALSADGKTAIVGGNYDNGSQGAVWVYTRSGSTWSQQGAKLVGTGNAGAAQQSGSIALSANGNIAIIGGRKDNSDQGAAWVFIPCTTPTAYTVNGGGTNCLGGSGVAVGLANSQTSVSYQLRVGGVNTGSPVAGTGAAISFGNQTASGTYTVIATRGTCTATMTGSVAVTNATPVTYGTLTSVDRTICKTEDPALFSFTTLPSGGSGVFTYSWYFQDLSVGVPSGNTVDPAWTIVPSEYVNASGTIDLPASYQPSLNRTYACFVTPAGSPVCGTGAWASGGVYKLTVNSTPRYGTIGLLDPTICYGTAPNTISLSQDPAGSSGYSYQWYSAPSTTACPTGGSTTGWSIAPGTSNAIGYTPPALTSSTNYALLVTPVGANVCASLGWANGCRKVTVLPLFNPGTVAGPDENVCVSATGGPSPIAMSVNPIGSGAYQWQWRFIESTTTACPTSSVSTLTGWGTGNAGPLGTFPTTAISYDPTSNGPSGRTWAVFITPIASGIIPACGTPRYANSCKKTFRITTCRLGADGYEEEVIEEQDVASSLSQNIPNPYNETTTIPCFIHSESKSASISIFGIDGKLIQQLPINGNGNQQVTFNKGNLSAGIYFYALNIDGQQIAIKKMVINN